MPQSLVLNLTARSAIPAHQTQGSALQQLFFRLVETVDPELGHVLRKDSLNRGYGLSPLQTSPPLSNPLGLAADRLQYTHSQAIAPKTQCWWRVTFLDDELFDHLIFLWSQFKNEIFPLGEGEVQVEQVAATPIKHPWASSCSYQDIYEQASASAREIRFQFITPTTFKGTASAPEIYNPLPTPEAVFQPLRRRWNRYSGLAFTPNIVDTVVPAQFNIQTEIIHTTKKQATEVIPSCIGQISFRVLDSGDPLIAKRLNALSDFTRYCPVGNNTLLGMGITRRIMTNSVTVMRQSS